MQVLYNHSISWLINSQLLQIQRAKRICKDLMVMIRPHDVALATVNLLCPAHADII
jgi:hypothetical protein